MSYQNEIAESVASNKIELTAHPLWLEVKLTVDGVELCAQEVRWDEIEKLRTRASEELYFDAKRRQARND